MLSFFRRRAALLGLALLTATSARAQLAVIDAPAVIQLVKEVQALQQEVATAENQLSQAKQALATMTGGRGMQLLLAGTVRNYLPSSWSQLSSVLQGGGAGVLAADVRAAVAANGVLTPAQLAALSPANQQVVVAARQSIALRQALAQESLANVSARFASLQKLIDSIGLAGDQKGILDLQARISAELAMLQNEQTKLQVLDTAAQTQHAIDGQRAHELGVAAHGTFAARFQPRP